MTGVEKYGISNKDQPQAQNCSSCALTRQTKAQYKDELIVVSETETKRANNTWPMKVTS